jgi:hypothetical protein
MKELSKAQQEAISRLIRRWITSETIRRYLRESLKLPVEPELPQEHKSLVDKLDQGGNR